MDMRSVVIAVDHEKLRRKLKIILRKARIVPEVFSDSSGIYRLSVKQMANSLIVLDTNDDIARLVQAVNDIHYYPFQVGKKADIIAVASEKVIDTNPMLHWWLIEGRAAVSCVWVRESGEFDRIPLFLDDQYFEPAESNDEPPRPTYLECVQAIRANPNDAEAFLVFGKLLLEWQNRDQAQDEMAIAMIQQALEIDPNNALAHSRLGKALIYTGEYDQAVKECREAVRLDPNLAEAHYQLGSVLINHGAEAEARAELKKAIEIDVNGEIARWSENTMSCKHVHPRWWQRRRLRSMFRR